MQIFQLEPGKFESGVFIENLIGLTQTLINF